MDADSLQSDDRSVFQELDAEWMNQVSIDFANSQNFINLLYHNKIVLSKRTKLVLDECAFAAASNFRLST